MFTYGIWNSISTAPPNPIINNTTENPIQITAGVPSYVPDIQPHISDSQDQAIQRTVVKATVKIKKANPRIHYWLAEYIDFGGRGTYYPTVPLSYSQAISVVRSGKSVFADSRKSAYRLALATGNGNPHIANEIHGSEYGFIGYWPHYHPGGHAKGHIFYAPF